MREIGTTPEGNHIMEVGRQEFKALASLNFVKDGGDPDIFWFVPPDARPIVDDLTNPLNAVYQWVKLQGFANQLRDLAQRIEEAIQNKGQS
jgi:hypothetical protein